MKLISKDSDHDFHNQLGARGRCSKLHNPNRYQQKDFILYWSWCRILAKYQPGKNSFQFKSSILLLPESFNPFCICERDKYISFPLYGNVDRKHYRTETYILNPDLYPTQRKFQLYKIYWRAFCADLNTDQLNVKPLVLGLPLVLTFNVTLVIFAVGACGIIILFQLYLVDVILVDL